MSAPTITDIFAMGGRLYASRRALNCAITADYGRPPYSYTVRPTVYQAFGNVNGEIEWGEVTEEFARPAGEGA
ncbi:hypothetical protein [Nonomuraea typhae]|uniref:hypothetical protein n=1 Tax=Nonomuraea typhae TaxID=2603600 RepID=UPI0012F89E3C|nr:hypothetical protein [Nonomuraea typhae]